MCGELIGFSVRWNNSEHELAPSVLIGVEAVPLVYAVSHVPTGKVSRDLAASGKYTIQL